MVKKNLCLMVCEEYKREASAVIRSLGGGDVRLHTYPSVCGIRKGRARSLVPFLPSSGSGCSRTIYIDGGCSGRLKYPAGKKAAEFQPLHLENCFYLFTNKEIIDRYTGEGAYLLTPGTLLARYQGIEEMPPARRTAIKALSKEYRKVVLLDTGVVRGVARKLQGFASFLGLPFESVPVGLDHFRMFLTGIVLEWRLEKKRVQERTEAVIGAERRGHARFRLARRCLVEIDDSEMVELKDISLSGIRLGTPGRLPSESIYAVKIFPSIKKEICLKGIVVWSSSKEASAGPRAFETGLRFIELDAEAASSLREFLRTIAV